MEEATTDHIEGLAPGGCRDLEGAALNLWRISGSSYAGAKRPWCYLGCHCGVVWDVMRLRSRINDVTKLRSWIIGRL